MRLRRFSLLLLPLLMLSVLATNAYADALATYLASDPFAVLAATTVTNTGATTLGGDLGVSPGTAITLAGPITLSGAVSVGPVGAAANAQGLANAAFTENYGLATTLASGLDGQTVFAAGVNNTNKVYNFASGAALLAVGGTLTIDFKGFSGENVIFMTGTTLTANSGSKVLITNAGANDNVIWLVGSSATIGTGVAFDGYIIANTELVAMQTGATDGCGSVTSLQAAVTLDTNTISRTCTISTGGGGMPPAGTVIPTVTGNTRTIPEPGTLALLSSGLLAMVFLTFRKSRVSSPSPSC